MRAIALVSGGLDSSLAAKLIKDQGIEIIALNFKTPFCLCDRKSSSGCISHARKLADTLAIELKVINVSEDFFRILKNPPHGYGSNMNPCIDCRILMFKKAKEFMQESGAAFIFSGEVVGQRPMSQQKHTLRMIERESGLEGLILRPLSAKILPETIPEIKGWVRREKLLDFNGRSRKPQFNLADCFGIKDYPCPAGGCLLTDPQFSARVKDLIKYGELNLNNIESLKVGRHFRFNPQAKLMVGRDEKENQRLLDLARDADYIFRPQKIAGPTALGRGVFDDSLIKLSCGITSRYSDLNGSNSIEIVYRRFPAAEESLLEVPAAEETKFSSFRI